MKIFLISVCLGLLGIAPAQADTVLIANLTGDQETPPIDSPAGGLAVLVLNEAQTQVTLVVSAFGIASPIFASHVHSGACGQFGFVEFGISGSDFTNPVVRVWNIPERLVQPLLDGRLYINIHTEAYPGGELRGQILPPDGSC